MKKRFLTLFLALIMLLIPLSSCKKNKKKDNGEDITNVNTPVESVGPNDNDRDDLPADLDLDGQTITIFSIAQWVAGEEFAKLDEETLGDGILEQAVFARNKKLEKRLNCTIENVESLGDTNTTEMLSTVEQMNQAGSGRYQILVTAGYRMAELSLRGLLTDLAALPSIDLGKDYYSQGFNKSLSVGESQYLLTGTFTMGYYRYLMANLFNKALFAAYEVEDPYAMVEAGEWTYDAMYNITKQMYRNLNSDPTEDKDDQYGYVIMTGGNSSFTDAFMSACDLHVVTKTDDNYYEVNINAERYHDAIKKVLVLIKGEGTLSGNTLSAADVYGKFANSTAAMITTRLYGVEDAGVAEMGNYGVLPIPKLDAAQQDYYSYVQDQCFMFGISNCFTGSTLTEISQFLEAFASESYHIIKPAYYDKALTGRYAKDPQSVKMLDLIGKNVVMDPANIYINSMPINTTSFRDIYATGENTVSSLLASQVTAGRLRGEVATINSTFRSFVKDN